ncbi:hypothetical protein SAMN05444365_105188 [Micromonospora pattaloongensis]|uniref:Uncharacterized protein n=1 Tax=Micromonospora pattaloongensis TaxID=405436 RepID=A0A1H3Q461_9ACTN|nr:hypothetical protein SAMN05444365_105188 [Micromonospora pattaloongensis]
MAGDLWHRTFPRPAVPDRSISPARSPQLSRFVPSTTHRSAGITTEPHRRVPLPSRGSAAHADFLRTRSGNLVA